MAINSDEDLCNLALLKVNQPPIATLNDNTVQARVCKETYEISVDRVFGEYEWSFAKNRSKVTGVNGNVTGNKTYASVDYDYILYGWGYKASLPPSCSKVINVYVLGETSPLVASSTEARPYELLGKFILSDYENLVIEYVSNLVPINERPQWFHDLCGYSIALDVSKRLPGTASHSALLDQEYQMLLRQCKSNDFDQGLGRQFLSTPELSYVGNYW